MAKIRLEEAVNLGLVDPSVYFGRGGYGRYGYSVPRRAGGFAGGGGGIQGGVPFWRLPRFLQSAIFQPRFGLGPLSLGLGLSPSAPAVGAPGAVPVGRPAARRQLSPEEQAIVVEQLRAVGALPQPSLGRRAPIPVGRGQTPAAARVAARAPVQATDAGVAGDLADAAALRQALSVAGQTARFGGQVARAVAGQPEQTGFLEGVSPEVQAALEAQRRGERQAARPQDLALARAAALNAARLGIGAPPFTQEFTDPRFPGMRFPSTGPITGVETTPLAPVPIEDLPGIGIDPITGGAIDLSTGLPLDPGVTIPPAEGIGVDPTTGLPLEGRAPGDITPSSFLPAGRAVGAGPVVGPGAAQRALTAPAQPSGIRSLARVAAPILRAIGPAAGIASGAFELSQGNLAGVVPLTMGALQAPEALKGTAPAPTGFAGGLGLTGAGLQTLGLVGGAFGLPPEARLGLSTGGSLLAAAPAFIPGTIAHSALLAALGPGAAGAATGAGIGAGAGALGGGAVAAAPAAAGGAGVIGAGAGAGATAGGAVAGGTGAAGAAAGTGGVLAGAGAALAAIAPVMALYAIGTTLGSLREADIERGYQRRAKEAVSALTASPDFQNLGSNLARYRAGDRTSLDSLIGALKIVGSTSNALGQPAGGSGIDLQRKLAHPIWNAIVTDRGDFDRAVQELAPGSVEYPGVAGLALFGMAPPSIPAGYPIPPLSASPVSGPFGAPALPQHDPYAQYRPPAPPSEPGPPVPGPFGTYVPAGSPSALSQFGTTGPFGAPPLHKGGIVPSAGQYRLKAGEAVLPAEVVSAIGRVLEQGPAQGGATAQGEPAPEPRPGPPPFDPTAPASPGAEERFPAAARALTAGPGAPVVTDPLQESDERASRVWRILQGHPRPGDPNRPWFVDSRRGVPFQGANNPDPDRVWRLVFSPAELAEAWPDRGKEGWPILLKPTDLDLDRSFIVVEMARQEQYDHPGFRIDFLRERGYPPEEYRTVEEESGTLRAFGEARRVGLGKRGFIDVGDELEGLGEEELVDNERRQRAIEEAGNPQMPAILEPEPEPEPPEEEEELAGAVR